MGDIYSAAINAGVGVLQGAQGLITSAVNNEYARQREKEARNENFYYGELAAKNADARTRNLYADLYSPQAQMLQLQEAGLSPSVFYQGASGISGQAGAQGTGAAGISPTMFGLSPIDMAQMEKTLAEADLLREQKKTEAGENEHGQINMAKILADAGLAHAANRYTTAQAELQELQNDIANTNKPLTIERYKDDCEIIKWNVQKAMIEACLKYNELQVSTETVQDQIAYYKEKNNNLIADTALKYANENLSNQELKESETRIWNMIKQLNIEWVNALANEKNAETQAEWINNKIPYIEKELDLEAEKLKIENKKVWVDGTTRLILGVGTMVQMGSKFGKLGQGGDLSPKPSDVMKPKVGGKATTIGNKVQRERNKTYYGF